MRISDKNGDALYSIANYKKMYVIELQNRKEEMKEVIFDKMAIRIRNREKKK